MSKLRCWCFTLLNPSEKDISCLQSNDKHKIDYIVYGHELTTSGIKHLQGYVEFNTPLTISCVKRTLFDNPKHHIHVESRKCKDREQAILYCKKGLQTHDEWEHYHEKGDNFGKEANIFEQEYRVKQQGKRSDWFAVQEFIKEHPDYGEVLEEYPEFAIKYPHGIEKAIRASLTSNMKHQMSLKYQAKSWKWLPWQEALIKEANAYEYDDRTIIWFFDEQGCNGKTTVSKYLVSLGDCAYFNNGKSCDLAHAYNGERLIIFDFSRSTEGMINYSFIEQAKNGMLFSPKYDSKTKCFPEPIIIVMSNFMPNLTAMTLDRWDIRKIKNGLIEHIKVCDKSLFPLSSIDDNMEGNTLIEADIPASTETDQDDSIISDLEDNIDPFDVVI